ncbi:MAG: amidinotransferase [Chloroflexota bacterium]|nr:amidinotransferase [Chloroflexota bacterium]MDE2907723.1 amidinotransferase [Chloroflexota bacterium]
MHLLPPFSRALMRQPARNFAAGLTTSKRQDPPDFDLAPRQHETYAQALRDCGLDVKVLPADERFPDGHFVEDPFVIFRDLAFHCRSGAPSRRGEGESLKAHLSPLRIVEPPRDARIDGGDVLFCADRVLVGISARTNGAGFEALRKALRSVKADILVEPVPFTGVLHLKSGLTELAPQVLIRDPALQTDYDLTWAEVIDLPPEEGYAADVMPVNDTLFVAANCPRAFAAASSVCSRVVPLDLSEFVKMDGGVTCLSLRY